MTTSASLLRDALVVLLKADSALNTALGVSVSKPHAIFRMGAPTGVPKPYIVVGSTTEDPLKSFGGLSNQGIETLHIWADGYDEDKVLEVYGHVDRLLNGTPLTVTGFAPVRGTVRMVFMVPVFENSKQSTHGVVEYASFRFVAA